MHRLSSERHLASNSCGPELLEKYRLDETEFTFAFRLVPQCYKIYIYCTP
ncbi:MAG: hypothetical protein ACLTSZ_07540 [Lachnospiraceae bacterium]